MSEFGTVRRSGVGVSAAQIDAGLRAHMNKVYGLMAMGMVITGLLAWAIAGLAVTDDPSQAAAQMRNGTFLTDLGAALYSSPLKWVVMFAPLGVVFLFGSAVNRLSENAARLVFFVFAALMGVSLSSIFLIYTATSITQTFFITAIAFLGLSLYGYTTKRDLSGMGTFLIMGVIGLIVASIVNIFLASSALAFAISAIGVLIFAGLTAYDTQTIKSTYLAMANNGQSDWLGKAAIMGALSLYLDFLNMFQFLLMFLGNQE